MRNKSRKQHSRLERMLDRLLTGEGGQPVKVYVEKVKKTGDLVVKHNLETLGDFGPVDFFMPLALLFVVFFLSVLGSPLFALFVQLYTFYDMIKRLRRRPSGMRITGMVPPYRDSNWLFAFGTYIVSVPFLLGAGWLNRAIVTPYYQPRTIAERFSESLFSAGLTSLVAVGLVVLFIIFFQVVIFAPITEEIWFRGIGLAGFLKHNDSRIKSVLVTSLIFGALHGLTRVLDAGLFGLVASLIRYRTGSTYCCIAVHMLHNLAVMLITIYMTVSPSFG